MAAIVDRWLVNLERAGHFDWIGRMAFAADLKATISILMGELGGVDPAAANAYCAYCVWLSQDVADHHR